VADIVQGNGVAFDRKQDAKDAWAAAIKHLAKGDAKLRGLILGDGMPFGEGAQLGDGLVQARIPAGSDIRGSVG
jgi:hypothetical protein